MPLSASLLDEHFSGERSKLEQVLRGHLWVESLLNRLLEEHMTHPETLTLDRMPFAQKLDLARALDLIRDEFDALRLLNRLRNRLAHTLGGEPTNAEINELVASLRGLTREGFDVLLVKNAYLHEGAHDDATAVGLLMLWFNAVLATMEFSRMRHSYERENRAALQSYHVLVALQERTGNHAQTDEELRKHCGVPPPPHPKDIWED